MGATSFRKALALILCAALLSVGLTACGQPENSVHEPITIVTGRQDYGAFVELLNERYPEVELEFISYNGSTSDYILDTLEHGDIPDIYTSTFFPDSELQKEYLLDLANYSVVNSYATTMLDSLSIDGGIYMLPSRYSLVGMVYNKTLLEENGWELPNSFEELLALAPEIIAAGYEPVNMNTHLTGTAFGAFFALGSTVFFNTPEGVRWKEDFLKGGASASGTLEEVAEYFQKWIDAGFINTYFYDNTDENSSASFDNREYVFQLYSNRLTGSTTDEYAFMPILSEDGSNNMLVRLVSRYYGLNKELGAKGNEQKLADALKVFEVLSSREGQDALSGGNISFISSTSINNLPEGSPYEDVLGLINSGSMTDMVYSGWERHIVPLIEDYGNEWIRGNITAEDFLIGMDKLNAELLSGVEENLLGVAETDFTTEDAARLCAIAMGEATGADAALISLPAFHGFASDGTNLENPQGMHSGFYKGNILDLTVTIAAPFRGSIATVTLTGSEITALAEGGFVVPNDPEPYEFCLVTKGGIELEPDRQYTLAINLLELSDEELAASATDTGLTPSRVMADYIALLGTLSASSLEWS